MTPKTYPAQELNFQVEEADPYAIDITVALQEAGFLAYIVGGGVRDLLLGLHPKDFDVATNATPEQVQKIFKNCRLIGRRFRLAHVFFRRHIVEVATFRGDHANADHESHAVKADDGIIMRDNVYGTLEEDAWRRDFTVNALYYDPVKDEILDFTDGMSDFQNKTIRLLGDPNERFQEDPVRILRAFRFAAKLGFKLDSSTEKAIKPDLQLLKRMSPGRIFDEYMKLFLHGFSVKVFEQLRAHDAIDILFPNLTDKLSHGNTIDFILQALINTDKRVQDGMSINPSFLIAVFLWRTVLMQQTELKKGHFSHSDAFNKAISEALSIQVQATAIPRRFTQTIREIWGLQSLLERRRPRQILMALHHKKFRAAFDFMLLRSQFGEVDPEIATWWTDIQTVNRSAQKKMIADLSAKSANPQDYWALLTLFKKQSVQIFDYRKQDPTRALNFQIKAAGIQYHFDKTHLTEDAIDCLIQVANKAELSDKILAMFNAQPINSTEGRAVLHTALRNRSAKPVLLGGTDVMPMIHSQLNKMAEFVEAIEDCSWKGKTGECITNVVNIGIGGSDLGPHMVVKALAPYHTGKTKTHFVSNVDASNLLSVLAQCKPDNTLFIIASKTFTTQETLLNANSAREWLCNALGDDAVSKHFVAITASPEKAVNFGIDATNCFEMWDFVGGRYSLWSTIGLSIALTIGMKHFYSLLEGAHEMDLHFQSAEFDKNLPVLMGLIGIWHRNIYSHDTHAVLPYDEHLSLLPAYLQQLEMESNGKSVDCSGEKVKRATCPIIWGSTGTNGQHAFHQLLHQGTTTIPADFILAKQPHHDLTEHHRVLSAHCHAQMDALAYGKPYHKVMDELVASGMDVEDAQKLAPHKVIPGDKPSMLIQFEKLTPHTLGALIALYEHKVFVQSVVWDINAFDQWGVELGKQLANEILAAEKAATE